MLLDLLDPRASAGVVSDRAFGAIPMTSVLDKKPKGGSGPYRAPIPRTHAVRESGRYLFTSAWFTVGATGLPVNVIWSPVVRLLSNCAIVAVVPSTLYVSPGA